MTQAYDFALDKIGLDVYAFTIWNDYVAFLKSVYVVTFFVLHSKLFFAFKGKRLVRMRKIKKLQLYVKFTNEES